MNCPERPGAGLRTTSLKIAPDGSGGHIYFKLFPDISIFYLSFFLFTLCGVVTTHVPPLRRWMHARVRISGGGAATTRGAVVCGLGLLAIIALWLRYWVVDHDWHNGFWKGVPHKEKEPAERAARTLGQLGNLVLGLLSLPVARNSVWAEVLHLPWEQAISLHRVLGYLFLLVGLAHMFAWWKVYGEAGTFPRDLYAIPTSYPTGGEPISHHHTAGGSDNFTIHTMTYIFYLSLPIFGILTYEGIRRKRFELFYYSHHFALVVYLGVVFHAASAWYYVTPGLLLYALDRALRFAKGCRLPSSTRISRCGAATRIEFAYPGSACGATRPLEHTAGQYCFVNVPSISPLQWHPFTISSAPTDKTSTIHAKAMGEATFTSALAALAEDAEAGRAAQPVIRIDGPYGVPPVVDEYTSILLVAGGIGVTPCHAILRDLYARAADTASRRCGHTAGKRACKVKLLWSVRHKGMACLFADTLRQIDADSLGDSFSYSLHLSRAATAESEAKQWEALASPTATATSAAAAAGAQEDGRAMPSGEMSMLQWSNGRPNVHATLAAMVQDGDPPTRSLVFVCGPEGLKAAASEAALSLGTDFHAETFEL
jgi:predicted ferric reductase